MSLRYTPFLGQAGRGRAPHLAGMDWLIASRGSLIGDIASPVGVVEAYRDAVFRSGQNA